MREASLYTLTFWMFVIVKFMSTALASWSWWWILLPIVPDLWLILHRTGVL